jgi:diamine N-acetyltransferase
MICSSVNRFDFMVRSHKGGLYFCRVLFAGVTSRACWSPTRASSVIRRGGAALARKTIRAGDELVKGNEDWEVRRASIADIGRLALIGKATFLETFAGILDGDAIVSHCEQEHSGDAYRRYLEEGGTAWLAEAIHGRAPIGFSLLGNTHLPGSVPDGSDIELKRIYTLSRFHGGGIGATLMQYAVEQAKILGRRRVLLGVYAGNARARAFYVKNGFRQIADRRFRVGHREYDDVVLARSISSDSPSGEITGV